MATLADLRNAVRRDLHDLPKPNEQTFDADPALTVYPIPTFGPILTGTLVLSLDGVVVNPATYTVFETGYVVLAAPPIGSTFDATFQWGRYSNEDLNQWVQEAIRELGFVHPKLTSHLRTAHTNVQSATLSLPYNPGDGQFTVNSTAGYDPIGVVQASGVSYYYSSIDATHFYGVQVWAAAGTYPDAPLLIATVLLQDDDKNHGWFYDPVQVIDVQKFQGFEIPDEFGIGNGYQDIAYFNYDVTDGYLHIEFDFSQLEVGNVGSSLAPLDQFKVFTSEMYKNPVLDTDVLDIPDYAFNPVSWLTTALAQEARETDRDFDYRENPSNDTTANPVQTFQRAGAANRKKWMDWVAKQFRASRYPISRRRMYIL